MKTSRLVGVVLWGLIASAALVVGLGRQDGGSRQSEPAKRSGVVVFDLSEQGAEDSTGLMLGILFSFEDGRGQCFSPAQIAQSGEAFRSVDELAYLCQQHKLTTPPAAFPPARLVNGQAMRLLDAERVTRICEKAFARKELARSFEADAGWRGIGVSLTLVAGCDQEGIGFLSAHKSRPLSPESQLSTSRVTFIPSWAHFKNHLVENKDGARWREILLPTFYVQRADGSFEKRNWLDSPVSDQLQ